METAALWAPITKAEKQEDGTLLVTGLATDTGLDDDGQRCDPTWLSKAMPDWMTWGNVREQHGSTAAGVGVELTKENDGAWWLTSHIVDPISVLKVETGVLKGYSIAIDHARVVNDDVAKGGRIVGGEIYEISIVDRPANPRAKIGIAKSADGSLDAVDPVLVETPDEGTEPQPVIVDPPADADAGPEPVAVELEPTPAHEDTTSEADSGDKPAPALKMSAAGTLAVAQGWRIAKASTDGDAARAIIASLAQLIISEAQGLADGDMGELSDIAQLLEAASCLRWFAYGEDQESTDALVGDIQMSAGSAIIEDDTIDSRIEAAVTKAVGPIREALTKAQDELAKVKATPVPGGPARTAPADAKMANREAALRKRLADAERAHTNTTDPDLRASYAKLVKSLRDEIGDAS